MCYDLKLLYEAQLKRARYKGDEAAIREIEEKLIPLTDLPAYHVSGFSHPKLLIYTDRSPYFPELAIWGLVPHWVKDEKQMRQLWNKTINARGETIFDKPSFRLAARKNKCLLHVDGFYEHHHYKGQTYPFYIYRKDKAPITMAGLYSDWVNPETGEIIVTFTIVTTEGNSLLSKIHNNPKLSGPRMPLILDEQMEYLWLEDIHHDLDISKMKELILSYPDELLDYHTVSKLRGKAYKGNVEEISDYVEYEELEF